MLNIEKFITEKLHLPKQIITDTDKYFKDSDFIEVGKLDDVWNILKNDYNCPRTMKRFLEGALDKDLDIIYTFDENAQLVDKINNEKQHIKPTNIQTSRGTLWSFILFENNMLFVEGFVGKNQYVAILQDFHNKKFD